jgi:hypothetical protein
MNLKKRKMPKTRQSVVSNSDCYLARRLQIYPRFEYAPQIPLGRHDVTPRAGPPSTTVAVCWTLPPLASLSGALHPGLSGRLGSRWRAGN